MDGHFELSFLAFATLVALGVIVPLLLGRHRLRDRSVVRRATGHALLGLQEFVEPGIEHVVATQQADDRDDEAAPGGEGDGFDAPRALADALQSTPIDVAALRRHLTAAQSLGMNPRLLYDDAVRAELAARPFRSPVLPPWQHVAPLDP